MILPSVDVISDQACNQILPGGEKVARRSGRDERRVSQCHAHLWAGRLGSVTGYLGERKSLRTIFSSYLRADNIKSNGIHKSYFGAGMFGPSAVGLYGSGGASLIMKTGRGVEDKLCQLTSQNRFRAIGEDPSCCNRTHHKAEPGL